MLKLPAQFFVWSGGEAYQKAIAPDIEERLGEHLFYGVYQTALKFYSDLLTRNYSSLRNTPMDLLGFLMIG